MFCMLPRIPEAAQKRLPSLASMRVSTMFKHLTAVIEKEEGLYIAFCPEVDVASQGETIEEAKANLQEALELFFEAASAEEVDARSHEDVFVTSVGVAVGET